MISYALDWSIPDTSSSTDLTLEPSKKPLNNNVLLSGAGILPSIGLTKPSIVFASGTSEPKVVNALKVKNLKTNSISELKVDGLFIAIGHDPATGLFKDQLKMDKEGYLITKPDSTETNIPGVFAAGDVKDKIFRQAVTAAGMGCMSALEAEKFISESN